MIEEGLLAVFLFGLGTVLGSFLHVIAERYGTSKTVFQGRSYCPSCRTQLSAQELIPLLSYIAKKGRCAPCGYDIPVHYPLTELCMGILTVALLFAPLLYGGSFLIPVIFLVIASVLMILIRIDSNMMVLPDGYVVILAVFAILYTWYTGADIADALFGILVGSGLLYLIWIVTGGTGIGFGDVKLMIPLGILFGLWGTVALLFFAFFAGGAVSAMLLLSGNVTAKTAVPFGPFLAGAALLLLVFPQLIDRFFGFLGVY